MKLMDKSSADLVKIRSDSSYTLLKSSTGRDSAMFVAFSKKADAKNMGVPLQKVEWTTGTPCVESAKSNVQPTDV